jgi:glycosyltransferase involved in cell wall biosynthesis
MHLAINAAFWDRPHTGSGQYTRQLVSHLARLVSDLTITLVYPQVADRAGPDSVPDGVRVKRVPTRPGNLAKVYFEQIAFPRACHEVGATVAHVPYWGSPLSSPVPVVVTVHDLTTLLVREYRRGLRARLYNALVAGSARQAGHIITDSQASKADIIRHLGLPADRVTPIYLAVSSRYSPDPDLILDMAIHKKYDLPELYVLYLGGYELHKNVTTLLAAYVYVGKALGEDYPLVLAGRRPKGPSDHYPDYDRTIAELGLGDYVRWIGFVEEGDKPTVYRGASTFAFVSRQEGFGLPPLEAMACGVPVVTSNSGSLPEVVGDAGFALDPDDERQIGGSIIATIVQENLAAELKEKGLKQAARFSWEKTATETLLIYDLLAGSVS